MNLKTAARIVKKYHGHGSEKYEYIGIRIQETPEQPGGFISHKSQVWDDGNMLDETLDGVCAIDVEQMQRIGNSRDAETCGYDGDYAIILGSERCDYGEDDGELIMCDAVVIDCIKAH